MKLWSYWFPDLAIHVPGCPPVLMVHELRRAAQTFFERSRAWRVTQAPLAVALGESEKASTPTDTTTDLVELEAAWYDGKPLYPITLEELDNAFHDDWQAHTGTPTRYLEPSVGTIRLYPSPIAAATTGLKLRLIVKPSDTATGLPDDMAARYRDAIHLGAKSRLMAIPGKPWTNFELAGALATSFASQADSAHTKAAKGNVNARVRARVKWC